MRIPGENLRAKSSRAAYDDAGLIGWSGKQERGGATAVAGESPSNSGVVVQ